MFAAEIFNFLFYIKFIILLKNVEKVLNVWGGPQLLDDSSQKKFPHQSPSKLDKNYLFIHIMTSKNAKNFLYLRK
jgi:hypothetical protein